MADESHDIEIRNLLCALPLPDTLYACWGAGCREEQTWPAEDLAWFTGREKGSDGDGLNAEAVDAGWYCPQCREQLEIDGDGPPLSIVLTARAVRSEPMAEDAVLIHALNMAGNEPAPHSAVLHELARTMLAHIAGSQLLPTYDPDKPLEGDAAVLPAIEIARREVEDPFTLQAVTLTPPLAMRIAIELLDMSLILQKAAKGIAGQHEPLQ